VANIFPNVQPPVSGAAGWLSDDHYPQIVMFGDSL